MKTKILTLLVACFATVSMSAQAVFEEDKNMSLGNKNAVYVDVEGANKKISEKAIQDILKQYGKVKKNKKAKEHYCEAIVIPSIGGGQPLDVFVKIDELNNQTRLYMWVYDGNDFISSLNNEEALGGAESILKDYYVTARRGAIQLEVDYEEDQLKDREKELKKMESTNTSMHKDIAKWEKEIAERNQKIEDMKLAIEQNLVDQENKRGEIEAQRGVITSTVDRMNSVQKN